MKVRKIATTILSHFAKAYDALHPIKEDIRVPLSEAYVARREDGKYYRGQKGWRWVNDPRQAAFLTKSFWKDWFIDYEFPQQDITVELIKATELKF